MQMVGLENAVAAEKNFENKIKKFIKDSGGWYVKFFANRMTKSGVPDLLCCINGYFVAIEVKASNGTASELQKHTVKEINKARGYAIILYPQDYDLFKQLVNHLMNDDDWEAGLLVDKINERSL